jgi:hypothetical protein
MHVRIHETIQVGDLIAAAFDEAALQTSDAHEATLVATRVVETLLQTARRALPPPRAPATSVAPAARVRLSVAPQMRQKDSAR